MFSGSAHHTCFVCGYPELDELPDRSDEICPSCGFHFGYDDAASGTPGISPDP